MHQETMTSGPSRTRRRLSLLGVSAAAILGLHAADARADVLNFSTNINPQFFGALASVDLNTAAGMQVNLPFATAAADLVEITFSAECSVGGTLFSGDDPDRGGPGGCAGFAAIPPTFGPDDAFCSGKKKTEQGKSALGYTRVAESRTFDPSRAAAPPPVPEARRQLLLNYFIRKR